MGAWAAAPTASRQGDQGDGYPPDALVHWAYLIIDIVKTCGSKNCDAVRGGAPA